MNASHRRGQDPAYIARPIPQSHWLNDPRAFAWEVLRRRTDYRAARYHIERLRTGRSPIDVIHPEGDSRFQALGFRRIA